MSYVKNGILIIMLLGVFAFLSSPALCAADSSSIATVLNTPPGKDLGITTKCAMCGMKLHVKKDTPAVEYQGKDYYFCDEAERDTFAKEPDKYLKQGTTK
ncbi:MAG TPA: YHS domain-containing protein [Candidatus Binataceae bacterium]|nr:YHS domain-containing protein [Candidatus Binataceae bacterium]